MKMGMSKQCQCNRVSLESLRFLLTFSQRTATFLALNKNLSYRRGTARRVMSVEILLTVYKKIQYEKERNR